MTQSAAGKESPVWSDLHAGLRAVKRSGLLAPHPAVSLWHLARSVARYGVSLYTVTAWNAQRWPGWSSTWRPCCPGDCGRSG